MSSVPDFSLSEDPVLPRMVQRLSTEQCRGVFVLNAFLGKKRKPDGLSFHGHVADLLQDNITGDDQLQAWLRSRFSNLAVHGPFFARACRQADRWIREGLWVAGWMLDPPCSRHAGAGCPRVLFGKGTIDPHQLWATFFNSRKGKTLSPHSDWIRILRALLPQMTANSLGIAISFGTSTHDLVAAAAQEIGAKILLVQPWPLTVSNSLQELPVDERVFSPELMLSCHTEAVNCPKPMRMVCRDRIIALISDLHCVLELRGGGNLLKILKEQQVIHASRQWIYRPEFPGQGNAGNLELLKLPFPSRSSFSMGDIGLSANRKLEPDFNEESRHRCSLQTPQEIDWRDYLYHYVRPCPGSWPNQAYREYLIGLFEGGHLAGHTALDTLVRILSELRIRAGSRVIRGDTPVVSWSSLPPLEISVIRRWNPALIRWTLEPYGLAVKRSVLKELGAKPVIYGASSIYERLPPDERFRFQLHEPPRCSWKDEREWRLPKDLEINRVAFESVFGFVPKASHADSILRMITSPLPILVLEVASK